MTHEFKPLVPSTLKGKTSFSISGNRINRVATSTSASSTSNILSGDQDEGSRGNQVAGSSHHHHAARIRAPPPQHVERPGRSDTRQLLPIMPRGGKLNNPAQKVILNTSGSTKFLLVNSSQLRPPAKRSSSHDASHVTIKRQPPGLQSILPGYPTNLSTSAMSGKVELKTSVLPAARNTPALPKSSVSSSIDGGIYPRPKKPCNCTKSMCLKLYCDCFANGEFCNGCNCQNCHNNIQHESER